MRSVFGIAIISFLSSFVSSCKNTNAYDKNIKELDSLKIVVEQAIDNFKTVDSLSCYNAYTKQLVYTNYINTHLKDTISKTEAENLQTFFAVGKGLKEYTTRRQAWISEAELTTNQLVHLSHDLKNGAIATDEAVDFINTEKKQAEKIIDELKTNTTTIRSCMDAYTQSLPTAEGVMKRLNNEQILTNTIN